MTTFTALAPYAVFRDTTRASIRPTATVARADREFEDLRRYFPALFQNVFDREFVDLQRNHGALQHLEIPYP